MENIVCLPMYVYQNSSAMRGTDFPHYTVFLVLLWRSKDAMMNAMNAYQPVLYRAQLMLSTVVS